MGQTPDTHNRLKRLAAYYRDILVAFTDKGGRHLHDLAALRSGAIMADLSPFVSKWQELLEGETIVITLPRVSPEKVSRIVSQATREEEAVQNGIHQEDKIDDDDVGELAEREKDRPAEALLAMYRKQEQDPYNRETLIGFPILRGSHGAVRYCAPLFYFPVRLEYEPLKDTIRLLKQIQTPAFNTPLLADLIDEEGVIDVVRKHVLPRLHVQEFDAHTIVEVVDILARVIPALKGLRKDTRDTVALPEVTSASRDPSPTVFHACVAVNARKGHTFLLDDLTELSKLDDYPGGTAIDAFLADTADDIGEVGDPDSPEQSGPLLFPLESNPPQRRAARKAERGQLTAVEGPPGTGKSQTIANLVCHLVANGKTVLVTSHQNKALEVVAAKLPRLEDDADRDYLAMPMLKGEAESARQLAGKLKHFDATVAVGAGQQMELAVKEALSRVQENTQQMRRLRARFSELKNLERQAASQRQWHYRYHDISEYDRIDRGDLLPEDDSAAVQAALERWAQLVQTLRTDWTEMNNLLATSPGEQAAQVARRVLLFKDVLGICAEAQAFGKDPLHDRVLQLCAFGDAAQVRQALVELADYLRANGDRLLSLVVQLVGQRPPWRIVEALALQRQLGSVSLELVQEAAAAEERAQRLAAMVCTAGPEGIPSQARLDETERALSRLERDAKSWFRWHGTWTCHQDRRWLEKAGFGKLDYSARCQQLSNARLWVNHWQARYQVAAFLRHTRELGLPGDSSVQASSPLGVVVQEVANVKCRLDFLRLIADAPRPSLLPEGTAVLERLLTDVGNARSLGATLGILSLSVEHLGRTLRLEALKREPAMEPLWASSLRGWDSLVSLLRLDPAVLEAVDRVRRLMANAEHFIKMLELEQGPLVSLPRTLGAARARILAGDFPQWLQRPDLAVEAHRLGSFIRNDLAINPDDIEVVAWALRKLGTDTRGVIVQALRRQRRLALWQAAHDNRTRKEIDRLRRLLTRKRKTASLMELREKVDYHALLKVFPCWVMGIEDVARVFPLEAGLFDYVIVDEASQCSQATALHLAYRGQRMIVVGDEKQLQNPWVRFLREGDAQLLLQKHRLHEHPNSDVMEARVSLLGLATRCCNSREFLDEHFRSEPPIISWSNKHFYNNRLKILTPIWPRRFQPCMEVRVVVGADDDPDDTRTNLLEAKAVISELRSLLENPGYEGLTIGLISPFRQQADLLQDLIYRELGNHLEWIRARRLVASTADGFQGDERDIILYSMRYGPSSKPGSIHAIEMEEERLNVAFTRARRKVICVVSVPPNMFPSPLRHKGSFSSGDSPSIRGFLEHALHEQHFPVGRLGAESVDSYDSRFEQDVCQGLRARSLKVCTQIPCAGFRIDLVVIDEDGRRLAVECDGDFHYEEGDLRPDDHQRQDILERAGWVVHRVSFRRFYANPELALRGVVEALLKQPAESEALIHDVEQTPEAASFGPVQDEIGPREERRGLPDLAQAILTAPDENHDWLAVQHSDDLSSIRQEDQPGVGRPGTPGGTGIQGTGLSAAQIIARFATDEEKDKVQHDIAWAESKLPADARQTIRGQISNSKRYALATSVLKRLQAKGTFEAKIAQAKAEMGIRHEAASGQALELLPIQPADGESTLLEGPLSESRNWFALSHWGKETGLVKPFDRGFAFNIGTYLHNGRPFSHKQARYARHVWRQATEQGYQAPH